MDRSLNDVWAEVLAEMERPRLVARIASGYLIDADGWAYDLPNVDAAQALSWLVHLRDKSWFTTTHETDLLDALCAAGVFARGLHG